MKPIQFLYIMNIEKKKKSFAVTAIWLTGLTGLAS